MPKFPITDVVSISKLQRSGTAENYESSPSYQNINATISPTNTDVQMGEGGVYSFQLFEVFIWDVTVTLDNGDKIVSGLTEYLVTGSPNLYTSRFVQCIRTIAKVIM